MRTPKIIDFRTGQHQPAPTRTSRSNDKKTIFPQNTAGFFPAAFVIYFGEAPPATTTAHAKSPDDEKHRFSSSGHRRTGIVVRASSSGHRRPGIVVRALSSGHCRLGIVVRASSSGHRFPLTFPAAAPDEVPPPSAGWRTGFDQPPGGSHPLAPARPGTPR